MIFIDNKYTKWYFSIVSNAELKKTNSDYTEKHHIIPKSLGGVNDNSNLAILTAREHFVCHWLLTKMTTGVSKRKMFYALNCMKQESPLQRRYHSKITSRVYATIKPIVAKMSSIEQKGKRPSVETLAKQKAGRELVPVWNKGLTITDTAILDAVRAAAQKRELRYKSGELIRPKTGIYNRTPEMLTQLKSKCKSGIGFSTKEQSVESRLKAAASISAARKGKPAKNKGISPARVCCLFCHTEVDVRNFARFHGNNCKLKN